MDRQGWWAERISKRRSLVSGGEQRMETEANEGEREVNSQRHPTWQPPARQTWKKQ